MSIAQKITLSVNEVADLIGVSTATIYTMARLDEIPHKKVRGRILFHRGTIEQWLMNDLAQ
ncbi:helix-turn-helix domain-containing protein [Sporosarcina sp. resist]|uniref:helix-turn-helix domain-containing protein n=1 Tax=Sporosarcina sp. resist TaxID=2762563 RepID=UPI002102131D|nr:helix-turn-helix domain-containing protein [Sporosarcina sp. resist]